MDNTIDFLGDTFEIPDGYIGVCTRAVKPDVPNLNGDMFPSEALRKAAKTYDDCQMVFVNHETEDEGVDRAFSRGFVASEGFDESGTLCLLIMVSKEFPQLVEALETGGVNAVSMGCEAEVKCGLCGKDWCEHMDWLGCMTSDGYAYDILSDINFEEISFVFDPADPTALIWLVKDPDPSLTSIAEA